MLWSTFLFRKSRQALFKNSFQHNFSIPHVHSPPHSLYWTRDGHVFTAKDRPGISLESEKVVSESTSKLFISHVRLSDSGKIFYEFDQRCKQDCIGWYCPFTSLINYY